MRIAHIMAGAPAGGAELFFERLTAAQHRAGDAVLPAIRRNPGRAARLAQAGLIPVQLPFGGPFDLLTRPRLRRHLARFRPHHVMAWMSRAAAMTPRGDYVLSGRLGGYYDLRRFRHCDHLVANTRGLVGWIAMQGWPAARVHHLPNFAPDLSGAAPASLPVPAGSPTVLAMGRLHRNKAFDVLIRAMTRLPGAHAVIAGTGPEQDALQALARREGVSGRVHLLGWRSDQAALLAACTVLACPSRQEPLGNVVLEAFSASRPVVAAAAAGPSELIRPGETGLLAPINDAEDLAEALGAVIADQDLAARLGAAGRAEFDAVHAEAPVLARWQDLLATLERH
jgi:glycosyltransferase involved in cell wall biosynthesis